jgi:hypothetical protein
LVQTFDRIVKILIKMIKLSRKFIGIILLITWCTKNSKLEAMESSSEPTSSTTLSVPYEFMRFLVVEGALDHNHRTVLHNLAAKCKNLGLIEKVIRDYPKACAIKDQYGQTPLHLAAFHGNREAVSMLIKQKVDINATDNNLQTPLRLALLGGYKDVARLLISLGAKISNSDEVMVQALLESREPVNIQVTHI